MSSKGDKKAKNDHSEAPSSNHASGRRDGELSELDVYERGRFESEGAFYRDLVEQSPGLVLCVAPDDEVLYANASFWRLLRENARRGVNFGHYLSKDSRLNFAAATAGLAKADDIESVELALVDTDGDAHPVQASLNAHFGGEGAIWFRAVLSPMPAAVLDAPDEVGEAARILVVEDEAVSARMIAAMLEQGGYHTDRAATAAAALEMLAVDYYDAMTLDLMLPDRNGLDLLREIRANPETEDMPVIVVSASANEARDSLSGDAAYVLDWFNKPFDPRALQDALSGAVQLDNERLPRVLHVEADLDFSEQLGQALRDQASIDRADTLAQARRMLQENDDYDLVLLGLTLPDGFGAELLPFLNRPQGRSVPVILVSADEAVDSLSSHVADTLNRSHTTQQQMLETIRAHLRPSARLH